MIVEETTARRTRKSGRFVITDRLIWCQYGDTLKSLLSRLAVMAIIPNTFVHRSIHTELRRKRAKVLDDMGNVCGLDVCYTIYIPSGTNIPDLVAFLGQLPKDIDIDDLLIHAVSERADDAKTKPTSEEQKRARLQKRYVNLQKTLHELDKQREDLVVSLTKLEARLE